MEKEYDLRKLFTNIPDYEFMGIKVYVKDWVPKNKILFLSKKVNLGEMKWQQDHQMKSLEY